jgi:integrase
MRGSAVKVKGVKRYFDRRDGRWYCYHRTTGTRIFEEFGTAEFFVRLAELEREAEAAKSKVKSVVSLLDLIDSFKEKSERYQDFAPRTKSDYEKVLKYLKPLWNQKLSYFTRESIVKLRRERWKKDRGRRFVNYIRTVLKVIFDYGIEESYVKVNPVDGFSPIRSRPGTKKLNRRWSDEERAAVWSKIKYPLKLPYSLALCYGVREGDMVVMPRSVMKAEIIRVCTNKRKVWVTLPIRDEVREAWIEHRREEARRFGESFDCLTLCTNSRGRAWTEDGFRASFFKFLKSLEEAGNIAPGCTYHGLRHSVASDIAEEEGTVEEDINAVLGQKRGSSRPYIEEADRKRRSIRMVEKLDPLKRLKDR